MADNSFWKKFLSPLTGKKEVSGDYDPEFKWSNLKELALEKNENEDSRCLSRMILKKLQVQTEQTEKGKKRKVNECNRELGSLIKSNDSESQSRESSQSAHREEAPSTSSAEDQETKRFKNVVVSSAMHSQMIADRQEEYPDDDEDTEDETQIDPSQEDNVRKVTGIINEKGKTVKQKSHQQSCVSSWNLTYLKVYVKREQVYLVKTLNASNVKVEQFDDDRFSDLQTSLIRRSRQILAYCQCFDAEAKRGLKLWSLQFSEPMLKEMTVSLMVFEVLCAVCQRCDVHLKPEEVLPKGEFPNARVDYALAYKDVVFGIVEIKTPKTMTPAALAQLLMPLLKLQSESGHEKMQYVGILTDGFRYVLVRLEGEKFTFEDDSIAGHPKLHIHKAVKWNDLHALCGDLQSVLRSTTATLEKLTKK